MPRRRESRRSKLQDPSSREEPSSKHQARACRVRRSVDGSWKLMFGASLDLGAWSLELRLWSSVIFRSRISRFMKPPSAYQDRHGFDFDQQIAATDTRLDAGAGGGRIQ